MSRPMSVASRFTLAFSYFSCFGRGASVTPIRAKLGCDRAQAIRSSLQRFFFFTRTSRSLEAGLSEMKCRQSVEGFRGSAIEPHSANLVAFAIASAFFEAETTSFVAMFERLRGSKLKGESATSSFVAAGTASWINSL